MFLKTYKTKQNSEITPVSITLDLIAVAVAYEHQGGVMVNTGAHTYYIDVEHDDFVDDWKDAMGLLDE